MIALALGLALVGLVVLPLVPALHEALGARRDTDRLPIAERYAEDLRESGRPGEAVQPGEAFVAPPGARYDVLDVAGDATLGAGVAVARRLVAGGALDAADGCTLGGSAVAGGVARLGAGVRFEHLRAAEIRTHGTAPAAPAVAVRQPFAPVGAVGGGRTLVRGALVVPAGGEVDGSLVVHGDVTLLAGARVGGSIKARGRLRLGAGAHVGGHAFAEGDIDLAAGASIGGVASSERTLTLGRGATVGSAESPATAAGRRVTLGPAVCVYGTVWASEAGVVGEN